MQIYKIKPLFQKSLNPIKNLFIRLKISPTAINVWALFFSLLMGFAFYYSSSYVILLLIIPVLALLRTAYNALDGMIARETKAKNQEWGEVLNESLDRLSDILVFVGLAFTSYVSFKLTIITLVVILFSSYLGIVSKAAGGKRMYSALMGKADRMFYLSVGAVACYIWGKYLMNYFIVFILVLISLTVIQRYYLIKKELKK
jgi:CDP-diacylglycerol---glycerol-3-phosphate 3-phosphatidyltransferase